MESPELVFVLLGFLALFVISVSALTFVPAYILWRKTKDKRYPLMWVTCSALIVGLASVQTFGRREFISRPEPINEVLSDVVDKSGTLRVTALRMPNPEQAQVRIEVDVENGGDQQQLLGIQCTSSGTLTDATSAEQTSAHYIWTVEPKWKGTLTCEAQLPGIVYNGQVTVVLARCKTKTPNEKNWLPDDSEAIYQNRFSLLPDRVVESLR